MLKALQTGQVSRVIPIIGTLNPVILLLVASTTNAITQMQIEAVVLLIIGMIALTASAFKGKLGQKELVFEVLSAVFFAVSYLILRQAYQLDQFLTVFSWSRLILIPIGLFLLAIPHTRKIVLNLSGPKIKIASKPGLLFAGGQLAGGGSELLLTFAISLANPALVNSLQGTQYVFLFLLSLILAKKYPDVFKDQLTRLFLFLKIVGIAIIGFGLYLLAFG